MAALNHPSDLKYTDTDEWLRVAGDEATIGITDYAQDQLGDIVSLELPWEAAGDAEVRKHRHFGNVDSVKASSELLAPISGTIVRVNDHLKDAPETINGDPYGDGWMLVIKISDPSDLEGLLNSDQYTAHIAGGH